MPRKERGPGGGPDLDSTLSSTADQSDQHQDRTAGRLALLERRVDRLEVEASRRRQRAARRRTKGCIVDPGGATFMPGVGWIPPVTSSSQKES